MNLPLPEHKNQETWHVYRGPCPTTGSYAWIAQWWDENFHTGPCWRGQVFVSKDWSYYHANAVENGRELKVIDIRADKSKPMLRI